MSPATARGRSENSSLKAGAGGARLFLFALLAILAAVAYTGFSGLTTYQQLDSGRRELVAAQAALSGATQPGSGATFATVRSQLQQAERNFSAARDRAQGDPAFVVARSLPPAGQQIDATVHLAAIGAHVSLAGQAAVAVAGQVDALKQEYAGRALTPENLPALLQQAEGVASKYGASAASIRDQLRAAHAERAVVSPGGLLTPLRDAYAEVDAALAEADTAFARYQDVRRLLQDLLGVAVP